MFLPCLAPPPGKSYTMIGKDDSMQNLGIIPCAISWLFKLINERKEKTGARFSVRISAVEVWGKEENLKDLLSEVATGSLQDGQSPGVYLCEDPICGTQVICSGAQCGGGGVQSGSSLGRLPCDSLHMHTGEARECLLAGGRGLYGLQLAAGPSAPNLNICTLDLTDSEQQPQLSEPSGAN